MFLLQLLPAELRLLWNGEAMWSHMNFSEILNWGEGQEIKQGLYEEGDLEYLQRKGVNECL